MIEFERVKSRLIYTVCRGMLAFYENRRAVTAIEYALIAGIITIAIVSSLITNVAPSFNRTFSTVASEL